MLEHNPGMAKEKGIDMTHQQMHDFAVGPEKQKPEHVKNGKPEGPSEMEHLLIKRHK